VDHKYSIEDAFRECFYVVPDYQREYVWTDKEVHQLLEDIGEQIDVSTTHEYFIGTVLVSPTDQKNHYEVIDGQQRLTTFFLLQCALRHLLHDEPEAQHLNRLISDSYTGSTGIVTRLKLDPRYESAAEVMAKVVEILCGMRQASKSGTRCLSPWRMMSGRQPPSMFDQGRDDGSCSAARTSLTHACNALIC
jgi:hypothetical protein